MLTDTTTTEDRRAITGLTSGDAPSTVVAVRDADGRTHTRHLSVHPLAQLIPLITQGDLNRLTDDIRENGVHEPLVMFEGKVLDGRNRLAVASVTGAPVTLKDFGGDEEAARRFVWSANAARRHLTVPQLALAATRFGFIKEAKETATAHPGAHGTNLTEPWALAASKRIGGAVSPRTLQRFDAANMDEAPDTVARIESGEIRRVDIAVKEAAMERSAALGFPVQVPPPVARTAFDRLGCARGDVMAAERSLLSGDYGVMSEQRFAERAREIQGALIRMQQLYRARRGFS